MKLNELTIKEAQEGLINKKFSSRELIEACLSRIKELEPKIKAFITVCEKEAIEQAKEADKKISNFKFSRNAGSRSAGQISNFLLLGIPIAVKDNFCTQGIKTTAASNVLANFIPPYDATVIRKLKEAGAIIIGKTNMDAWAHGSSTETSDFFTSHNPWNPNYLPGGSSGGSAAAVAADETVGAIGSETAGSIRQPAAWCGVTGLKPTYGRASRSGLIAMASSLDCPGPLTKTVKDAALLLRVLAGYDSQDATTSPKPVSDYLANIHKQVDKLTIGVPQEYFSSAVDKEVILKVSQALKVLEKKGARLKKLSLFDPKYAIAVYTILQRSEVSSNLGRYDGIRYGEKREKFGEEAKRRIMLGTYCLSAGYYNAYYLKAQEMRTLICRDFLRAFKETNLIIGPTSPSTALPLGSSKNHPMFGEAADMLVESSTIAGLPGLSIPCGFSAKGLPVGMQIIGPQFSEELLLRVGYAYERETQWHKTKPAL